MQNAKYCDSRKNIFPSFYCNQEKVRRVITAEITLFQAFSPIPVQGSTDDDCIKVGRKIDATCGSGGFLVKALANMIREAGGAQTDKAKEIKQSQLYGIEFDREIYALACANMLIHKNGKTNLEQMDARTETAGKWITKQGITKVLMNLHMRTSTAA